MVCQADSLMDPATLKKVAKSVVQEEDSSRNIVIFRLPEKKDENIEERVQGVVQVLVRKREAELAKLHYIRTGTIHSKDKQIES